MGSTEAVGSTETGDSVAGVPSVARVHSVAGVSPVWMGVASGMVGTEGVAPTGSGAGVVVGLVVSVGAGAVTGVASGVAWGTGFWARAGTVCANAVRRTSNKSRRRFRRTIMKRV